MFEKKGAATKYQGTKSQVLISDLLSLVESQFFIEKPVYELRLLFSKF